MDFIIISVMFLMVLMAGTWGLVELGFLCGRVYRFWRYSWPSHLRSWRLKRSAAALRRRYLSGGAKPVSFGRLRFTKHRAEQFGDGPPEA